MIPSHRYQFGRKNSLELLNVICSYTVRNSQKDHPVDFSRSRAAFFAGRPHLRYYGGSDVERRRA